MSQLIPMSGPDVELTDIEAVESVLSTRHLSMGPQIEKFEREFRKHLGTSHAAGVNSGTSGLHLAVLAAGVGEGDVVITTPFSFISSASCILYERGIPVFVDIDPQTLNIDPLLVAQAVQDLDRDAVAAQRWLPRGLEGDLATAGRLRAILPVDVFGQPADYDRIQEIAKSHDLVIIEDACEAIGAEYKGRRAGTLGDVAVFAFYPNKQMTTGEGGMIVTDRDDWDGLFRSLRNQGRDESGTWLNHVRLGYNYRLDEMSAALGLAQLGRIDELLAKRERVAQMYSDRLQGMGGISIPHIAPTTTHMSWFVYVVRLAPGIDRDAVMQHLHERGIACRPYFTPIHLQPFYVERFGYRPGDFPVTEAVSRSTLALPFHGNLQEHEIDLVYDTLRKAIAEVAPL
jgi:perosamine synthetase